MPALYGITCPHCRKQGKGPIELEGKYIRCRNCKRSFQVKISTQAKAGPPAQEGPGIYAFAGEGGGTSQQEEAPLRVLPVMDEEEESSNPYGVTDLDERRRCPYCADLMEEEDVLCLNCGYNTQTRQHIRTERTFANTPGDIFVWLLPGILCVLAIFATIGMDLVWWFFLEPYWWKPMDDFLEHPSISIGIRVWGVIFSMFAMYFLGRFAFRRLILHPTPPEMKKDPKKQSL
jgi:hypothetical protein